MSDTDRVPPHDNVAEKTVLGLAIGGSERTRPPGTDFLVMAGIVKADDFYTPAHTVLWRALGAMVDSGKPLELGAIASHLRATKQLGAIGRAGGTDDDGAAYLTELVEGYSFSTANAAYYAKIVADKARLRRLIIAGTRLADAAFDHAANPRELAAETAEVLRTVSGSGTLPSYVDAAEFLAEPLPMADSIIAGLLRRGETATMVSASKARKSWTALELLVDVATGGEWFGLQCRRGRGLLIDGELQRATLQHRLNALLRAKDIDVEAVRGRLRLTAWRGLSVTMAGLAGYLGAIQPGDFDLIVLDPIYKLYPPGFDENSNAAMAELFGNFQAVAEQAQAALLLVCHSPKGDTSARTTIDLVSGAGSAGRAVDVAIGLRTHAASAPGAPVIVRETISRSFPDLGPACFRWEHPRWIPADDLDPADLAKPGGRKKKPEPPDKPSHDSDWIAQEILSDKPQTRDSILALAVEGGVPNANQSKKLLERAEATGRAFRWSISKDNRAYFANIPQPALVETQ